MAVSVTTVGTLGWFGNPTRQIVSIGILGWFDELAEAPFMIGFSAKKPVIQFSKRKPFVSFNVK